MSDLKYALRQLWKSPGFTAVAVMILAIGIGANTAIFSVVNAILLNPLPYDTPGQLVRMWGSHGRDGGAQSTFAPAEITLFKDHLTSVPEVGMFDVGLAFNLTGGSGLERVNAAESSPGLFSLLRVKPLLGRVFLPDETEIGQSKVVLISEGLWRRRFGADPNLMGRMIQLDGEGFTVVGVLPSSFKVPESVEIWVPFSFTTADWQNDGGHYYVQVAGRLKPETTLAKANAELATLVKRTEANQSDFRKKWGVTLTPMAEPVVGPVRPALILLLGAIGFGLLIACANVANLLLVRATARRQEFAVRLALGAGKGRLVQQLLTESMALSLLGGAAGMLLASADLRMCSVVLAAQLPRGSEIVTNGPVAAFSLLLCLATRVGLGLMPALASARTNLSDTLKDGGQRAFSLAHGRARDWLVGGEVALSLMLLVGAGLLTRSFVALSQVKPGFDPNNVLTMELTLPKARYPDTVRQNDLVERVLSQIRTLPGVESAAATINLPMVGTWGVGYSVKDQPDEPGQSADWANVTPEYFRTMRIPVVGGRDFSREDNGDRLLVAMVSAGFVRKHFATKDPIGQIINVNGEREIVGVVADVHSRGLETKAPPEIYLPYAQKGSPATFLTLAVRSTGRDERLAEAVKQQIWALDKDLPVANVGWMERIVAGTMAQRRLATTLLGSFAALALALALMGIYGVVSYSVAQRTREIGIRIALGAARRDVVRLVVAQGLRPVWLGLGAGFAGAFALHRLVAGLLFGVGATDPTTFALTLWLMGGAATLGCLIPARRASRINPLTALRYE